MAADDSSHDWDLTNDQDVKDKGAFETSLRRYLKRADRRTPLPDGFLERLQRDTPTQTPTAAQAEAAHAEAPQTAPAPAPPAPPTGSLWQGANLEGATLQGRYLVEERISKGGMSWIYRGTHTHLNTPIAVKVLFPELVEEPTCRKRFFDEARALSQLDHPNIVRVFDVFDERGLVGMALEWVEGGDLYTWYSQRKTPMQLGQVHDLFAALLDALEAIHDAGMIHRDLKPDNILLDLTGPTPQPKIADFGLVRAEGARSGGRTHTGARLGTPLYMSPEQIKDSKSADQRADLYSLGAILYELLLGGPPFEGDEQWLLLQQLHAPPTPPHERWSEIPEALAGILQKALAKAPEERFQSCAAFREALLPCLQEHKALTPVWQTPPPQADTWQAGALQATSRRAHTVQLPVARQRWLVAALVLLLCGATAWYTGPWRTTPASPPPSSGTPKATPAPTQPPPPATPAKATPSRLPQKRPAQPQPRASVTASKRSQPQPRRARRKRHTRPRRRHRAIPAPRPATPPKTQLVTLRLRTQPGGAIVWVDGKRLPGTTPLTLRVVAGQSVHVKLVRRGYKPITKSWAPERTDTHKTIVLHAVKSKGAPASPKDQKVLNDWK